MKNWRILIQHFAWRIWHILVVGQQLGRQHLNKKRTFLPGTCAGTTVAACV
jgi:hypothetical protein